MIDDAFILKVERLRDSVEELKKLVRARHQGATDRVGAAVITEEARRLAEVWMVEVVPRADVRAVVEPETLADYNIGFQRLLTISDRRVQRREYDSAFRTILKDFRARVVLPLKQARGATQSPIEPAPRPKSPVTAASVFVAHSFAPDDQRVVDMVTRLFKTLGLEVITGEKPKADLVSNKVRERILRADLFVGVFSRRDKLSGREEWATSAWVIDEKAFALANGKKLVLLKEESVNSIGGLQGDYEYLEFSNDSLESLCLLLLEVFLSPDE